MRPRVFKVPPGLRVRGLNPGSTQPAMVNAPVRVSRGVSGINNYPAPDGTPGSATWPYTENLEYGNTQGSGMLSPAAITPPAIGQPPPMPSTDMLDMISVPFGASQRDWNNPTTYATIPLLAGATGVILQLNYKRNSLIIQNTSTATSPDVAPTLYVGFNVQPAVGASLALPPGLGFYWSASDCPPRDAINVVFGPSTGASVVVSGCVIQGTYSPGPYVNPNGIAPLRG